MSPGTDTRATRRLTPTGQTPRLGVVVPVKQVPLSDSAERLGHDGRLLRDPEAAELYPWCRRPITVGLRLARELGVPCTAVSGGPPSADRALREARAAEAQPLAPQDTAELALLAALGRAQIDQRVARAGAAAGLAVASATFSTREAMATGRRASASTRASNSSNANGLVT